MNFDWDSAKSESNKAKHGLSISGASALWKDSVVTIPSKHPDEIRHLAIGMIEGRHWTVIYTTRGETIRLISARRSRKNEKDLYQKLTS